ncbi:hypothetical protein [Helicobacter ailurogastricus]|uniref:Uncharacterized protein n=1 Tax=Helicobacter ailurogastricus TaxID=1578720 RepID=A0A0K2X6M0_9HELI|nr:hypothetical protein [Helicobacter ailurogastricus]CRF41711.1 hypothetical protein HAL011_15190 [Helicobacter ailurogastricus]CRF42843.1 hypothetical protein HAL013_10530 [Helicobacter ailurogastricus]CRF44411.1 hypothetical protein HAL09_09930 [Helicobacter ailurogastricus]
MQKLYIKVAQGFKVACLQSDIIYLRQRFPKIDTALKIYDGVPNKERAMLRALLEICFQARSAPEVLYGINATRETQQRAFIYGDPSRSSAFFKGESLAFGGCVDGGFLVLDRVVLVPFGLGVRFEGVELLIDASQAQGQDLANALKSMDSPQEFLTQLQTHFSWEKWGGYLGSCTHNASHNAQKRVCVLQNAHTLPGLLGVRPYPLWLLNPKEAQELHPDHICQSISQNMAKTLIKRFAPPLRVALVKMIASLQVCLIQVEGQLQHSLELIATVIKHHTNQQDKILLASSIAFKESLENKLTSPHTPLSFCDLSTQELGKVMAQCVALQADLDNFGRLYAQSQSMDITSLRAQLEASCQQLESLQEQTNNAPQPQTNLDKFLSFLEGQKGDFILPSGLLEPIYNALKEDLNALAPLKFSPLSLGMPAHDFSSALKAIYQDILHFEQCDQEVAKIDFSALQEGRAKLTQEIQELKAQKDKATDIESLEALQEQIRHKEQEQRGAFALGKYAKFFGTGKLEQIKHLLETHRTKVAQLKAHFSTTLRAQAQNFRPEPKTQPTECQVLKIQIQDLKAQMEQITTRKAQVQASLEQIQKKYSLENLEQIPNALNTRLEGLRETLNPSTPTDTSLCFIPFGSDPSILEMASPFDVVVILDEGGLNLDLLPLILNTRKTIWLKSTHTPNLADLPEMPSLELQESLFATCFANAPSGIKAQIHLKELP